MRTFLGSVIFLTCCLALAAANDKTLTLRKAQRPIELDGRIDAQWALADSVSDFVQFQPFHGKDPTRRTTAKVLTTEDALYALIVCEDDRKDIQTFTGKLDDGEGDVVSIMIDTFGDRRTAYKFAVTASGVRSDCRLLDDARNRDYTWDGVWFSGAEVYDWGYVVEIEVPYRSIQYDKSLVSWGLDFDRWRPVGTEDIYWCTYEESEGQRISKFGRLVFDNFRPTAEGLNLELYPVGIMKGTYVREGVYSVEPRLGIDVFYNPSPQLTFQMTANPDFAQIEADPFAFNITRYESYFQERRLFFIQGQEIFTASGREQNTGFYRPVELFYSRRIGKKLPDGDEVPIIFGAKAFGRLGEWEYGGFYSMTGQKDYVVNDELLSEPQASFASARVSKQIFDNSSVGMLFVGKHTALYDNGVIDIDGAFRASEFQVSYQLARSYYNSEGDFGGSAGLTWFGQDWITFVRGKYFGDKFNVEEVGFVPWKGTWELTGITGPRWYFPDGYTKSVFVYGGMSLGHENVDAFTDRALVIGYNMQFRTNWGFEVTAIPGRAQDYDGAIDTLVRYNSLEIDVSTWFNTSPAWHLNVYGGYAKTYNFSRHYQAPYAWAGAFFTWKLIDILELGTSADSYVEWKPSNALEDITYNARPYVSVTPLNDLNLRAYVDIVYTRSSQQVQSTVFGFLFAYSFLPKSWIYFALNENRVRDGLGPLEVRDRAGVLKIQYLYYF